MASATLPPLESLPSADLIATWTGRGLFLWARAGELDDVLQELPGVPRTRGVRAVHAVAVPRTRTLRATAAGLDFAVGDLLAPLSALPTDVPVSDAVRCWSLCAKFALELVAAKRIVPTVDARGDARWIAVLARPEDRARYEALAAALPAVARWVGDDPKPSVRAPLMPANRAVRTWLDAAVDHVMRTGAYPGPARGWALDYARALCGSDATFALRDARAQATPERIATWAGRAEAALPRVGFALELPDGEDGRFPLRIFVHRTGDPSAHAPVAAAWRAGRAIELGGVELLHPADAVLRGLARAARIHPPLQRGLTGSEPTDVLLDAAEAWAFLDGGRAALEASGFSVRLPPSFERAGKQRIRARIRLTLGGATLDLSQLLTFRWEVLIGDQVLDGPTFARLCKVRRPIVRYQREWVFLDPEELAKLPRDLSEPGTLSAPEALTALLTGEHHGVPVVADERLSVILQALREPPDLEPPAGLQAELRPYQRRGYAWLSALGALGLGALLADDMGLGKTVQLIAYLLGRTAAAAEAAPPSLVVCPTSVLGNWQRELRRFAPALRVVRWHGLDRDDAELGECDVLLTTYGLLVRDADRLASRAWDVVVLDEAQSVKNPDSRRARTARRLAARHRVALSGTPVENRLDELWSVMEFLVPGLLGARAAFQRRFAVPIERFGDEEAAALLRRTVAPFLLRRSKSDPNVAGDLPEKVERREYCELTPEQRALYQAEVDAAMAEISGASEIERRGRVLAMLTALKQICNHPVQFLRKRDPDADLSLAGRSGKLERVSELVEEIVSCGERIVMFTQYREMGELLRQHLHGLLEAPIPFLHGGTPALGRDEMVRRFQDGTAPPLLIVSLKAGGTGLSLTRATHVIHYDRWWNPAVEDQATDRAHRIGQHETVVVHKVVCEGTLEERIDAVLDEKRELFDAVVGSGERWVTELDDDALLRLVLLSPP